MLVIRRKLDQSIIIDGNIKVMVTYIGEKGTTVKIGIDAPRDISVHREEIQQVIDREKSASETAG